MSTHKRKSYLNWKTIGVSLGLVGFISGGAVTAFKTDNAVAEIKDIQKDVDDLKTIVGQQQTLSSQQYAINQNLLELLRKKDQ